MLLQNRIGLFVIGFEEEEVLGLGTEASRTVAGVTVDHVRDGCHKFGSVGCTCRAEEYSGRYLIRHYLVDAFSS
jgi:hypothetical protein